jgi:hypothetical protein
MADELEGFGNGNGHLEVGEVLENQMTKQALIRLDKRGDGNIFGQMDAQQLGVMQKMATAPVKDDDYRQALLLANFMSAEESDRAVNAIAFCQRYGGDLTPIVNKIIARCAVKGGRVSELIDALTHMRLTQTTSGPNGNRNKTNSPLR